MGGCGCLRGWILGQGGGGQGARQRGVQGGRLRHGGDALLHGHPHGQAQPRAVEQPVGGALRCRGVREGAGGRGAVREAGAGLGQGIRAQGRGAGGAGAGRRGGQGVPQGAPGGPAEPGAQGRANGGQGCHQPGQAPLRRVLGQGGRLSLLHY
eukprot:3727023-Pyramimonas_sp.AAC.1